MRRSTTALSGPFAPVMVLIGMTTGHPPVGILSVALPAAVAVTNGRGLVQWSSEAFLNVVDGLGEQLLAGARFAAQ